jgi:hypothetical protein
MYMYIIQFFVIHACSHTTIMPCRQVQELNLNPSKFDWVTYMKLFAKADSEAASKDGAPAK